MSKHHRVTVRRDRVAIPTYPAAEPDKNPMFLERRVYQGSSGRVYPLPFIDRMSFDRVDREYDAYDVENEYLFVRILPELGGRIQIGQDKTNGYDFFYRNQVIKPALVGLAGPWISGGVEFNWPQHHRPSTFMPCESFVEEHEDGSKTVWLSEHEPMGRMKGMHGICLHPGKAVIELKVRLYNRTSLTQTFLWWANVAARVHEHYQSFFPPDVRFVADHAKRAISTFPACSGRYYGVDYAARGRGEGLDGDGPLAFPPDGSYRRDRLDWYANIPVPTSYMVLQTEHDFFGGYDHSAKAGFVYVADRHIAPGKKQWTWGNHAFGYAWDRNLTDEDGPYVELMAGAYTDNQPDFAFLTPYETKSFSQFWYPIQGIGPCLSANLDAAIAMPGGKLGVATTSAVTGLTAEVLEKGRVVWSRTADVAPDRPWVVDPGIVLDPEVHSVRVVHEGRELVSHVPKPADPTVPEAAVEPAPPSEIATNEQLYRIGVHLDQYRHATRSPRDYWLEAIYRDPWDARSQTALGKWHLQRGEFAFAAFHLTAAVASLTRYNPNPPSGETHYLLGLTFESQGEFEKAQAAFAKAAWNYDARAASEYALARLACRNGDLSSARVRLHACLSGIADHNGARCLLATLDRLEGGTADEALKVLAYDPLDHWALREASLVDSSYRARYLDAMRDDAQNHLDLALDYASAGFLDDARAVLSEGPNHPMLHYAEAFYGDPLGAARARRAPLDYVFPHRNEEMAFLESAIEADPTDPLAPYLLGNLLYDRRRYADAIASWKAAVRLDPANAIAWRNLGIAYHNHANRPKSAAAAYEKAIRANPDDARLRLERDHLWRRLAVPVAKRLRALERRRDLVAERDDLTLELGALYLLVDQPERARELVLGRRFAPWEGGEGGTLGLYVRSCLALSRTALARGDSKEAVRWAREALSPPLSLGEVRHPQNHPTDVWFCLGEALSAAGNDAEGREAWARAALEPASMSGAYHRALALRRLGREEEARSWAKGLLSHARKLADEAGKVDFFATSVASVGLFHDDESAKRTAASKLAEAQARALMGQRGRAAELVRAVLSVDPAHPQAHDFMVEASLA